VWRHPNYDDADDLIAPDDERANVDQAVTLLVDLLSMLLVDLLM
jgi:hypothetical protein